MLELSNLVSILVTPITFYPVVGVIARPGQLRTLSFDGTGISDFLKNWKLECEEYGLTDTQKCKKLPRYCSKDIGEAIQKFKNRYDKGDQSLGGHFSLS